MIFISHKVSAKDIEPDPNKVKAILQMPEPTSVYDLRRLMGMANCLAKFVPQLATVTVPLKDLLREKSERNHLNHQKQRTQYRGPLIQTTVLDVERAFKTVKSL